MWTTKINLNLLLDTELYTVSDENGNIVEIFATKHAYLEYYNAHLDKFLSPQFSENE